VRGIVKRQDAALCFPVQQVFTIGQPGFVAATVKDNIASYTSLLHLYGKRWGNPAFFDYHQAP
jgi:hypothetical protein